MMLGVEKLIVEAVVFDTACPTLNVDNKGLFLRALRCAQDVICSEVTILRLYYGCVGLWHIVNTLVANIKEGHTPFISPKTRNSIADTHKGYAQIRLKYVFMQFPLRIFGTANL